MKIAIKSPANGTKVSGQVVWEATVSGDLSNFDRVEFRIDAVTGTPAAWTERVAPFYFNGDPNGRLDTTKLTNGQHKLGVRAIDKQGRNASNTVVYVDVQNAVTPPPPPPPPPPPSGSIVYTHDYLGAQASGPDYGWDWGFYSEQTPPPAALVKDGFKPGVPSMRFTFAPGSGTLHAEGLKKWPLTVGEDLYYGLACKFSQWGEPSPDGWGAAIFQGDYQACVNHTWGLFAHADHVRWVDLAGAQTVNPVTRTYNNTDGAPQGPSPRAITGLQQNVWYRIILRVKSAYDNTGLCQIWVKGAQYTDWTKTVDVPGIPTLQYGSCYDGHTISKGASGYPVSHKFGYYTGSRTSQRVYEHANIKIGTSLAAVQAALG